MNGEQSFSLPDRYYRSPGYVVRTDEEDAVIRRLIADVPAIGTYRPPMIVTPGTEMPSVAEDIFATVLSQCLPSSKRLRYPCRSDTELLEQSSAFSRILK